LKEIDLTGSLRGTKSLFRKNTLPLSFEGEGDKEGEVERMFIGERLVGL